MQLPFLCEKSGAIALALPSLMAGRLAGWLSGWLSGWLAGRPADKIVLNLKNKILYRIKYQVFVMFNKGTVLL